jgi:hypothetical protein
MNSPHQSGTINRLDRHALVMAVWLPLGFVALTLIHRGFAAGQGWWVAAGFAPLLLGFATHLIINAVTGISFTSREVSLALSGYALALLALVFSVLLTPGFATTFLLPVGAGMIVLAGAVIFYMVTSFGLRRAFDLFDVIRDNNPRRSSRLPHRGGRK